MPSKKKGRSNGIDLLLAAALIGVLAFIGYQVFVKAPGPGKRTAKTALPESSRPIKAVPPAPDRPGSIPKKAAPPPVKARVGIIIDDLGTDMDALDELLELDAPLAISVLPGVAFSRQSAERAGEAGREVMMHLPMQPKGESMKGLGPGALMLGMDGDTIRKTVLADLETVPGAMGVNNHMGSALTEDGRAMASLMEVMKARGMFFVDSRTSSDSRALSAARGFGVPASSRKVFLDDSDDPAEIKFQFERLVKVALKDGEAIAIGHPRPATIELLKRELPGLRTRGVEVVRVSSLVR